MTEKKYISIGGYVGLRDWVGPHKVAHLYKVPRNEVVFICSEKDIRGFDPTGMKILRPDFSGTYDVDQCPVAHRDTLIEMETNGQLFPW